MIRSFTVLDPNSTHISWWNKVTGFDQPRTFEFKPGLNVIFGPNGCGKSTIIKALARLFHCEQGYESTITHHSVSELFPFVSSQDQKKNQFFKSVAVDHDGQSVRCFDTSHIVGLSGANFDDDFFLEGVKNQISKGSSGQFTLNRFHKLASQIVKQEVPKIKWKEDKTRVNNIWSEPLQLIEDFLQGNGEKEQPTILLDEPDRSLDFPRQVTLWEFIRAFSSEVQFIVASHSFYALNLPEAHYLDLKPGYLAAAEKCFQLLSTWKDFSCTPEIFRKNWK